MSSIFFSYSHKDEALRDRLETGLSMLKRQGIISVWHDRRLLVGADLDKQISHYLESADIILLLVSPDFLASEYCYGKEMSRALERHQASEALVIPVILRPCDWHGAPFSKLVAVPTDGKPITKWPDLDDAFLDVTQAIRRAAENLGRQNEGRKATERPTTLNTNAALTPGPRSSNLRLKKTFTDHDRDVFLDESFEFIARFFENSLQELKARNTGYETAFKRIDANRFTVSIYRNGQALSHCQIRLGDAFGKVITYSHGPSFSDNTINESLSVETGEQSLYLKPMGMAMLGADNKSKHLSAEGAAEYYWSLFIERLQPAETRFS